MNIIYNIAIALAVTIIGYLLGSIPNGVIVGKIFYGKDPRDFGSHNSGGTNVTRLWGFKIGIIVYVLDFLKAVVSIWGTWAILTFVKFGDRALIPTTQMMLEGNVEGYLVTWPVYWLAYIGAGIGHCWPIFAKFKGGKAAAVTFAGALFTCWPAGTIGLITFFTLLLIKKYVSLSSIVTAIVGTIIGWLTLIPAIGPYMMIGFTYGLCPGYMYAIAFTVNAVILIYRHKANIIRLIHHEENKIGSHKK